MNDSRVTGYILFRHDAEFSAERMSDRPTRRKFLTSSEMDGVPERRVKTPIIIAPDALDFTQLIRAGETIGWAEVTAEPVFLTRLLDAQAERCPSFRVFFALTFSDAFGADNAIPANISDISGLVSSGLLPIDVVLLQVSGPDETGRYNAGLGIEHLHAAIGSARLVIAQVNPELPWTHGDTAIEPTAIDVLVPAAAPPIELPTRPAGRIDRAIANHVSRLIPDRATIELGLGAIPQAVTRALGRKAGSRHPFRSDR